jgi:hypothetical protein
MLDNSESITSALQNGTVSVIRFIQSYFSTLYFVVFNPKGIWKLVGEGENQFSLKFIPPLAFLVCNCVAFSLAKQSYYLDWVDGSENQVFFQKIVESVLGGASFAESLVKCIPGICMVLLCSYGLSAWIWRKHPQQTARAHFLTYAASFQFFCLFFLISSLTTINYLHKPTFDGYISKDAYYQYNDACLANLNRAVFVGIFLLVASVYVTVRISLVAVRDLGKKRSFKTALIQGVLCLVVMESSVFGWFIAAALLAKHNEASQISFNRPISVKVLGTSMVGDADKVSVYFKVLIENHTGEKISIGDTDEPIYPGGKILHGIAILVNSYSQMLPKRPQIVDGSQGGSPYLEIAPKSKGWAQLMVVLSRQEYDDLIQYSKSGEIKTRMLFWFSKGIVDSMLPVLFDLPDEIESGFLKKNYVCLGTLITELTGTLEDNFIYYADDLDRRGTWVDYGSHTNQVEASAYLKKVLEDNGYCILPDKNTSVGQIVRIGAPAITNNYDCFFNDSGTAMPILDFSNAPVDDVFFELSTNAGMNVILAHNSENKSIIGHQKLSVRWKDITAKQAMMAICKCYNLSVDRPDSSGISRIYSTKYPFLATNRNDLLCETNPVIHLVRFSDVIPELGLLALAHIAGAKISIQTPITSPGDYFESKDVSFNYSWENVQARDAFLALCGAYNLEITHHKNDSTNYISQRPE